MYYTVIIFNKMFKVKTIQLVADVINFSMKENMVDEKQVSKAIITNWISRKKGGGKSKKYDFVKVYKNMTDPLHYLRKVDYKNEQNTLDFN